MQLFISKANKRGSQKRKGERERTRESELNHVKQSHGINSSKENIGNNICN